MAAVAKLDTSHLPPASLVCGITATRPRDLRNNEFHLHLTSGGFSLGGLGTPAGINKDETACTTSFCCGWCCQWYIGAYLSSIGFTCCTTKARIDESVQATTAVSWSKPGMKKIWVLFAKGQEAQARNMQTPDRNWQGCKPTSFLVRGNRRQPPLFFSVCMWVWRLSLCPKSFNSHSPSSLSFPPHRIMYYLYRFSYCGISPKTFSVYNSPPSTRRGNCIFFYLFIFLPPWELIAHVWIISLQHNAEGATFPSGDRAWRGLTGDTLRIWVESVLAPRLRRASQPRA